MNIVKSSRHSKIAGDFGEHLILYWLSKYGFECARVDHTGIDLIARNPKTRELMGISVKSRTRNPGTESDMVSITNSNIEKVKSERRRLVAELKALKFEVPDSAANFVLAKTKNCKASEIYDKLAQSNIYVRHFDLPGLEDKLRISVGTPEQNDKLLSALKKILSE